MTLYTPLLMQAVTGDPAITYSAQDFRNIVSALSPVEGIVWANDLNVTQRGAGANMSVDVAAGKCLIAGDSIANQGTYVCYSDAVTNVALTAANSTNPRIDIIIARVRDKQADGGTVYGWSIEAIAGTPAATPTVPATPASAIKLAEVRVNAAVTSVTTANVTDRRQLSGVGSIPAWDFSGASTQTVAHQTPTIYTPTTQNELVGVQIAGSNGGIIRCQTPGRYACSFSVRFNGGGASAERSVALVLKSTTGVQRRQMTSPAFTSTEVGLAVSGTLRLAVGETLQAQLFQMSGTTLGLLETGFEADFTGAWVGP